MIAEFIHEINALQAKARAAEAAIARGEKAIELSKKLTAQLSDLREYKRKFDLIESAGNIEICEGCDGHGGGMDGDSFCGFQEWQCEACAGSGWKEKKQK
jgi:hypothetical protein